MSLGDELWKAIMRPGSGSEPRDLESAVRELVHIRSAEGMSRRAFAREYGIPESTLRRIEKGGTHSEKGRTQVYNRLKSAWRQSAVNSSAAARWRADNFSVTLGSFPKGGRRGGTETRTVTAGKLAITSGTGAAIVDHLVKGDRREAARTLARGVRDPFYQTVFRSWLPQHDEDLAGLEYEGYDDGGSDYGMTVSVS